MDVETSPSKLVYFNPFSDGEMRVYLPEGDHVFRAAFLNDEFVAKITSDKDAYDEKKEQVHWLHLFYRPVPRQSRESQPEESPHLRTPSTGQACVERIVVNLAHHAIRRPVTRAEGGVAHEVR